MKMPPRLIRHKRPFGILLTFLLMMASCLVQAQPLLLTELPKGSLGTRADLLVEDGSPISLEEAQTRQREGLFHQGDKAILSYGIGARPLWVHLDVFNPTADSLPLKMVAGMPWLDRLSVYLVHDNQIRDSWQTGDAYRAPQGLTPAIGFSFALNFPPGRSELYLRAESIAPLVLPIELMTEEEAHSNESLVKYSHGLLYGYLIALLAYNMMLFAGLRERNHLYYSSYLASFVLLNLAYTGQGYAWLWPEQPLLQRYVIYVLMLLYCCCGLLFASRFLSLAEHAPRVSRLMRLSAWAGIGLMALSLVSGSQLAAALLAFSFVFLFNLSMVLLGIFTVSHGLVAGRYFLMATIFGMLGAASTSLATWGWLPFNSLTYHGVDYGIAIEATLLALALAHRYKETNEALLRVTVSRDVLSAEVAERKLAEERLRQSERSLRESQMIAGLGSYALDITTGHWESSAILDKLFGIDAKYEHSIDGWAALIHPEDRDMMTSYFNDSVLGQGKAFDKEYRIVRHDDSIVRWVHGLGRLEFNAQGQPEKMLGTIQDISEHKMAERKLNELLSFNQTILNKSPVGIVVFSEDGQCVMANEAYVQAIGGESMEGVLKQNFRSLESWKSHGLLNTANKVFETGLPVQENFEGMTTWGKKVLLECTFAPLLISEMPHLVLIVHDIRGRIAAERNLKISMHQLEEKEQAKTRFLAAAGHDLRQPLAAANLFIDALKSTAATPDQNRIIQRLDQAMANFNGLLDALLDISKLDSGIIKPEPASISVIEIFSWLEESIAPMASEKHIRFRLHFPVRQPLVVQSDIGLLKSALMNLVSNAIKYTSKGSVLISARRRGCNVLFQIWDTGIGIADEQIGRIFDEFYQVNNAERDRTKGIGLGLPIAKRALSLIGGEIVCRSRVGRGSVFEFRQPVASNNSIEELRGTISTKSSEFEAESSFIRGKRFVVVEDDVLVSEALSKSLEMLGGEVQCFDNAESALQHPNIGDADCYVVDYMLPGDVDGINLLLRLRQQLRKSVCAVMMSGNTSSYFIRKAEMFDWPVLHKPVSMAELIFKLSEQHGRNA